MTPAVARIVRSLLWPGVRYEYPMISNILAGMVGIHLTLVVTCWWGYHPDAWFYFGDRIGLVLLGVGHLAISLSMISGVYANRMAWVRAGLLTSVTIYLLQLCLLLAGISRIYLLHLRPPAAWEGPAYTAGLVLLSISAYRHLAPARTGARHCVRATD